MNKGTLWLSVYHIPGKLNVRADQLSRLSKKLNDDMEWELDSNIFNTIQHRMGFCEIDMFSSGKNCKLTKYVSYLPDPKAYAINAFSLN